MTKERGAYQILRNALDGRQRQQRRTDRQWKIWQDRNRQRKIRQYARKTDRLTKGDGRVPNTAQCTRRTTETTKTDRHSRKIWQDRNRQRKMRQYARKTDRLTKGDGRVPNTAQCTVPRAAPTSGRVATCLASCLAQLQKSK